MYQVIDCETNLKNEGDDAVGEMKASPFSPHNHAVYWGYRTSKGLPDPIITMTRGCPVPEGVDLLVGHNIKFDLHYLWKADDSVHQRMYSTGIRIWCTQLAEYLLTGQDSKWASLDELSAKYGGTIKDSRIKEYWDAGVDTEDIDPEEIMPYLDQDIRNTELVFLAQVKKTMEMDMMPLMMSQMEALLATCEMEYNGMAFDAVGALETAVDMAGDIRETEIKLEESMARAGIVHANPASSHQISCFLFGGMHKYLVVEDVLDVANGGGSLRYKSGAKKGEVKTHKVEHINTIIGTFKPKKAWANKEGYSVANDVLSELLRHAGSTKFIKDLLDYRRMQKDVKTYYVGISNLTWPDGFVHGNFNHCNTNTGRLSSSAPNLQNITTKEK